MSLEQVIAGKMDVRQAATSYSVPESSLFDRGKALRSGKEITLDVKLGRSSPNIQF